MSDGWDRTAIWWITRECRSIARMRSVCGPKRSKGCRRRWRRFTVTSRIRFPGTVRRRRESFNIIWAKRLSTRICLGSRCHCSDISPVKGRETTTYDYRPGNGELTTTGRGLSAGEVLAAGPLNVLPVRATTALTGAEELARALLSRARGEARPFPPVVGRPLLFSPNFDRG